jgi:hypothetical protein
MYRSKFYRKMNWSGLQMNLINLKMSQVRLIVLIAVFITITLNVKLLEQTL